MQREKEKEKNPRTKHLRTVGYYQIYVYEIYLIGIPTGEKRENWAEEIFEVIKPENFTN